MPNEIRRRSPDPVRHRATPQRLSSSPAHPSAFVRIADQLSSRDRRSRWVCQHVITRASISLAVIQQHGTDGRNAGRLPGRREARTGRWPGRSTAASTRWWHVDAHRGAVAPRRRPYDRDHHSSWRPQNWRIRPTTTGSSDRTSTVCVRWGSFQEFCIVAGIGLVVALCQPRHPVCPIHAAG